MCAVLHIRKIPKNSYGRFSSFSGDDSVRMHRGTLRTAVESHCVRMTWAVSVASCPPAHMQGGRAEENRVSSPNVIVSQMMGSCQISQMTLKPQPVVFYDVNGVKHHNLVWSISVIVV